MQGSFNTHVNRTGEEGAHDLRKNKNGTFEAIWTVGISTAVDHKKSTLPRKTLTWVSEEASVGNKSSKDGPRT